MTYSCRSSGNSVSLLLSKVCGSLIIQYQIRSHGFSACNDPWDPHRSLGIDLEGIFMLMSGPNLFFKSRVTTDWEMKTLPIIKLTDPVWNPADLQMSRPLSSLKHAVICISTAPRNVWSDSATHLIAISASFDRCTISSLFAQPIPPAARCAHGDKQRRDRRNVYERTTAFNRYI